MSNDLFDIIKQFDEDNADNLQRVMRAFNLTLDSARDFIKSEKGREYIAEKERKAKGFESFGFTLNQALEMVWS